MKIDKFKENWFFYLILIQPILDIIAYFQVNSIIGTIAGYIRLVFMIMIPIYVFVITDKKKSFFALMCIIGGFSAIHLANDIRVGAINIVADLAYLMRVIQMPVLCISFIYYFKSERFIEQTRKAFVINFLVIFVSMIIAHATGTGSWSYIGHIGLKGWFSNSNSQSIILVTLTPMLWYTAFRTKKIVPSILAIAFAWFMLISNGTKAAYYSCFLIPIAFIAFFIVDSILNKKVSKKFNVIVSILLIVIAVGSKLVYPLTPRYAIDHQYASATDEKQKDIEKEMEVEGGKGYKTLAELKANDPQKYQKLLNYYETVLNEDFVSVFGAERMIEAYGYFPDAYELTDIRRLKIMYSALVWEDTDFLTKLVGFEYTKVCDVNSDRQCFDLESDIPAIKYYYGYIGFGLYALLIVIILGMCIIKGLRNFKLHCTMFNFTLLLILLLQIGLAQYSGAILRRPNVSIYMSIVLALIYYSFNKKDQIEDVKP